MVVKFNKNCGFTIIELLIVVVVIAVLIGIGTVVYSGVVSRANTVNLLSDLDANSGTLRLYFTSYGSYPTALDANRCPSAPTADTGFCLKLSSGNTLTSYSGSSANFELIISNGSLSYVVTPSTTPTLIPSLAGPTISSIYSGYDLLFCRFASNCSGVSGISSDFSYQVAFTAKAGSKYSVNMLQVDNTSTNWTSGTAITTSITYSTPTAGATLSSNIITTTNAGETRVTFTGTGLLDKTLIARITEVDNSNNAISQSSRTKALGVYTTVGSYTLTAPASATVNYLVVAGGGGGGNGGGGGGGGGALKSASLSINPGVISISVGGGGNGSTQSNVRGNTGSSSVFSTITSSGGGGGGTVGNIQVVGGNGACGGGAGVSDAVAMSGGTGSDGGAGGVGYYGGATLRAGGGGGMAGGGSTGTSSGNGGGSISNSLTGSSVSFAGGGGGGARSMAAGIGSGGAGNGGADGNIGSNATVNTGSGGGGGGNNSTSVFNGGNGGSGIVIFRIN